MLFTQHFPRWSKSVFTFPSMKQECFPYWRRNVFTFDKANLLLMMQSVLNFLNIYKSVFIFSEVFSFRGWWWKCFHFVDDGESVFISWMMVKVFLSWWRCFHFVARCFSLDEGVFTSPKVFVACPSRKVFSTFPHPSPHLHSPYKQVKIGTIQWIPTNMAKIWKIQICIKILKI